MTEKHSPSNQEIIDCLKANYGIEVIALQLLPIGADMDASVYKAQAQNLSSYFIKLKRGHTHDFALIIPGLLHDAGIQQVVAPIKTLRGHSSQPIREFTLIMYPFIQGKDGFSRILSEDQWLTLGKTLRQVHEFKAPPSVLGQIRQELYSPKWRKAVRSLYTNMEAEPSGDMIAQKLLRFMKIQCATIQRLVDRAEELCQKIQQQSPEFVLCHADIHGGNVLVADDGAIHIVDWDDPIMAPKERDLMFIGGGVANVWNNSQEEEFFYKGYGKTEINKEILAYYRHERIVEDIAEYIQSLLLTTEGGDKRQLMYEHFIAMFEPRGVIDIAFKTDEGLATT